MVTPATAPDAPAAPRPARASGLRPTRRAALAVAGLAVATVALRLTPAVVLAVLAVGAGVVVTDAALARRNRPVVDRTGLPVLARSTPHSFGVTARLAAGTAGVRLRQPVPPELAVDPSEVDGTRLAGTLVPRHRGVHPLPPAVLRVRGPLGLASCDHTAAGTDQVTVLPDLPRARRLAEQRRRGRTVEEGRVRNRLGLGTEFESIREYAPDDDIRQVNWLVTARIGRPMTNQYRIDDNRDLVCLVDCGRLMAAPVGGATRLDVALDALAVLAVAADDAGDRVGAVAFAGDVLRRLEPRRRGAAGVVRTLFDLEPVEVESDYERAFQAVAGRKRALVVLFTDLVDPAAARTVLGVVPVVARRHALLVVSCRDPDLDAALATPPADDRAALRGAVALDLLDGRRRTVSLLRRFGATVVEAPPEALGPACAAAYGRLKSAGRL